MHALLRTLALAFLLMVAGASDAEESPLPDYPGQPNINSALKSLTAAQKLVSGSGATNAESLLKIKDADRALEASSNNKGSFRRAAIRLTGQAIKHLEKGDIATSNA